jgi:citrate lyase subunit beta/citryl-CoA lyase
MDGKSLIHPCQIEAANRIFRPSEEERAEATRIVAAFTPAEAQGKGVIALDGRMVERLHLVQAERVLTLAAAIDEEEAR